MKKALTAVLVSISLLAGSAARAESSIACMYMLLRVLPCRARLLPRRACPKTRKTANQRLRASMEQFIRANAKNGSEAMIGGIDRQHQTRDYGLEILQSDDFKLARICASLLGAVNCRSPGARA